MRRLMITCIVLMFPCFVCNILLGIIAFDMVLDLELNFLKDFLINKLNTPFLTGVFCLGALGAAITMWTSMLFLQYVKDINKLDDAKTHHYNEGERYRRATEKLAQII